MVEFGGWDMPVEYSGITEEHLAVRTRAGLFDVSHMGQIELAGPDALAVVQWLTCNDAAKLSVGQVQVLGTHDAGGDVRRRHPGVPDGRRALSLRGQRRQHHERPRMDRGAGPRPRR
jgi:hypothetical protein